MKLFIFLLSFTLFACPSGKDPDPIENNDFAGKYFYAAKDHESGDYGAMDLIITVDEKNGVTVVDDFADPSFMGTGKVSEESLSVEQHVEDNYDTRHIKLVLTRDSGVMRFTYDVDFTQATGDYNIEGILTRQ